MAITGRKQSHSFTFTTVAGAVAHPVWSAPFGVRVTGVRALRNGGTSASCEARINGTSVLTAVITTPVADVYVDGASLLKPAANLKMAANDVLSVAVTAAVGSPTYVRIQVDFEIDGNVR